MSLFTNKQKGTFNKHLNSKKLDDYLEMTKDFKSSFSDFVVIDSEGFNVIDESKACPVGFKARAGEFLIQNIIAKGYKEVVYVQPRRGFAGISLSYVCKKLGLKLTLIMPSSKECSPHQLYCIEQGANPLFMRVAAMPNANTMAEKYAKATGAYYVPLGLDHEDVIACAVKCVYEFFENKEQPTHMWSVISTGVLQRSLQIALPHTDFTAVAVARNIQHGELGRANFYSYHKPFKSKSDYIPDFDCENSYDSKGFDIMREHGLPGDWFFSVAGEAPLPTINPSSIVSYRDWRDYSDFKFLNK